VGSNAVVLGANELVDGAPGHDGSYGLAVQLPMTPMPRVRVVGDLAGGTVSLELDGQSVTQGTLLPVTHGKGVALKLGVAGALAPQRVLVDDLVCDVLR
jgi:hypothetical protein